MNFHDFLASTGLILAEGSIYEQLRRHPSIVFDPYLANSTLIYDSAAAAILEKIHRDYLDVGQNYGLPMTAATDTWRANKERISQSKFAEHAVNQDNVRFLRSICNSYGHMAAPIFICGVLGPMGDAYRPDEALAIEEAEDFHRFQIEALAETGVDFIKAATLPAFSEALGIARAIATTRLPYILSFVIRDNGTLLDGTPLHQAIQKIDAGVHRSPLGYAVNCVHPTVLIKGLNRDKLAQRSLSNRLLGFSANTSARNPEELDGLEELEVEEPEILGLLMQKVHQKYGTKILGGCCGTGTNHIEIMAQKLTASV
jgi:homocysteine S-methyltransferase